MLTIHHLGRSQSERIVWLCEELELPYEMVRYTRDPKTRLSPPELQALHPIGSAPVLEDDGIMLAESGAIVEYILTKYGNGRLTLGPSDPHFTDYLYWLHFANGTLQPGMGRNMVLSMLKLESDHPLLNGIRGRLDRALRHFDERLAGCAYLAGETFTAADIMSVFSLTTMRLFYPADLSPHPAILAYLQRIGARPGYQRAMTKGDPGFEPLLSTTI